MCAKVSNKPCFHLEEKPNKILGYTYNRINHGQ